MKSHCFGIYIHDNTLVHINNKYLCSKYVKFATSELLVEIASPNVAVEFWNP